MPEFVRRDRCQIQSIGLGGAYRPWDRLADIGTGGAPLGMDDHLEPGPALGVPRARPPAPAEGPGVSPREADVADRDQRGVYPLRIARFDRVGQRSEGRGAAQVKIRGRALLVPGIRAQRYGGDTSIAADARQGIE